MLIAFSLLAARVAQLQLFSGDKYTNLAAASTVREVPLNAERGSIFDRNGRDLALSIRRTTIYADPKFVADPLVTAKALAPLVKMDEQTLLQRLSDKGTPEHPRRFVYIARTVSDDVASAVHAAKLPGIGFVPESARSYPAGAVAGSLIGAVHADGTGAAGIEYVYRDLLAGKAGKLVVEQDPLGHDIPNTPRSQTNAVRGTDLVLTLDENMQYEMEYSLLDQVIATQAKGGMAAIVDVKSGDVLAMSTVIGPSGKEPARVARPGERNNPLTELYEPGSTSKLITISWALEHGLVTPSTAFDVADHIYVDPAVEKPYVDHDPHPITKWTTSDIIQHSSNVGTIMIAQKMHNQDMDNAVRAFGFGSKTNIDWPGQPNGLLIAPDQYYATGKYATSIGYGTSVTGMQVLGALTTIANDGVTRPARLLDATIDENGDRHTVATPAGKRVVSSATAEQMGTMLQGVVAGGTGACAAVRGYTVAGKTGTSKKLGADGKYSDSASMASFEGFAPADNPRFAAIVVLDEPLTQYQFGGTAAAPVFSEIMGFALNQYGVAGNDPGDVQFAAAMKTAVDARTPCSVPHGQDLQARLANLAELARKQQEQKDAAEAATTADSLPADRPEQND